VEGNKVTDDNSVNATDAVDPLVLAIDIGSSSVRALMYDARGRAVLGWDAHRPYATATTSDGGVEVDPRLLLDLVCGCVDDVVRLAVGASERISAVACDTFWHSVLGVAKTGDAVTPIYTWADTRSGPAARELQTRMDQDAVHARTGAVLHSSYVPAKLLWLTQTRPDLVERVDYWMSFGEYLYLHLFGVRRVSISMASGSGLLDQGSCTWDSELLDELPIDAGQLSPVAEFSDVLTDLRAPYRQRWSTLHQVPWFLPLGDGACNNVGSGGFCRDWAVAMIGTSAALRVVYETSKPVVPRGLWSYRVDHRRVVQGGALSEGGNVFAWLTHALRVPSDAEVESELTKMSPDGHGLTVLPFLAGERSPNWNANARSAIVGITLNTSPIQIVRACMEAIAYRIATIYDILVKTIGAPRGIIGSGAGLIRSPAWIQITADVLGRPIAVSAVPEASSRGAALLVLEALGVLDDLSDAPAALGTSHMPKEENTRAYRVALERQNEVYRRLIG
jgi:gluconokinase